MNAHPTPLRGAVEVRRALFAEKHPPSQPRNDLQARLRDAPRLRIIDLVERLLPQGPIAPAELDDMTLAEIDELVVLTRIHLCRGCIKDAAASLDVSQSTLNNRLAEWRRRGKPIFLGNSRNLETAPRAASIASVPCQTVAADGDGESRRCPT